MSARKGSWLDTHVAWLVTAALVTLDTASIVVATVAAYYTRFEGAAPQQFGQHLPMVMVVSCLVYVGAFAAFGLYHLVLRHVGVDAVLRLAAAAASSFGLLLAADMVARDAEGLRYAPVGVLIVQALLVTLTAAGLRLSIRVMAFVEGRRSRSGRRVLIVGAGDAGSLLLRDIDNQPDLGLHVVGFLDDSPSLQGHTIRGVPIIGTTVNIAHSVASQGAEEVLLALPTASPDVVRRILNEAADAGVKTRVMPRLVVRKGSVSLADLRKVEVEDLLGREPAQIDVAGIAGTIAGRVVAVTGAAGSIGSELCRQIMTLGPSRLLLLEVDESRLYELWLELSRTNADVPAMLICDVRDPRKVEAVFSAEKPQVVLHAAAYKHVPLMELEPAEAVRANVIGTRNVIEACVRHNAERFVLISTDKAVAPQSVMGATKAVAEGLMLEAAAHSDVKMVAVRFGNVLGSRGSVIPIFEEQLRRGGPLTVTHPDVTRYFMTISEAARLVLQAQAIGQTGDVFVLEMGEPVRIADLARKMILLSGVSADIEFTGLRPAEKLHEILVTDDVELEHTSCEKIERLNRPTALPPDFDALVERLVDAAAREDGDAITRTLGELLPSMAQRNGADAVPQGR